jgi:hypothetical protein
MNVNELDLFQLQLRIIPKASEYVAILLGDGYVGRIKFCA